MSDFDSIFNDARDPDRGKNKGGRPRGKASNPEYCQLIARVPFRLKQDFKSWLNQQSTHKTGILEISEAITVLLEAVISGDIEAQWLLDNILSKRKPKQ